MQTLTLSFLLAKGSICLALKKRGFGEGNWNGYGGKLNGGEGIKEGAVREILEESAVRVDPRYLEQVAYIEFLFENGRHLAVHTFFVRSWNGEPEETEEMSPQWFSFTDIPYTTMWEDDQYWLPRALLGEKLKGKVRFDHTDRHIKEMEWERISCFDT